VDLGIIDGIDPRGGATLATATGTSELAWGTPQALESEEDNALLI